MRILVHDFSGHPFQAELARSLGARGHDVLHVHCTSYQSGKGRFADTPGCRFDAISLGEAFNRYDLKERLRHELRYAKAFVGRARAFRPDVIISCNDPLMAKFRFGVWAAARRVPWVFWLQDVYSVAMSREAAKRSKLGTAAGAVFMRMERWLLKRADAVVAITEDFDGVLDDWGVAPADRTVIENWAPLDEIPVRDRDNPWRKEHIGDDGFTFLYSGTLGLKHDPDVLYDLAVDQPDAHVVVISEGLGAEHLAARQAERSVPNLRLLPFQPWEELPDVLGAADVLLVLLEAEAGGFSVPSKVLTSLCAGRPILAAVPPENLAARTIEGNGAGIVVPPGEPKGLRDGAKHLRGDPELQRRCAAAARAYAEASFAIGPITDRFLEVIHHAAGERSANDEGRVGHRRRGFHRRPSGR